MHAMWKKPEFANKKWFFRAGDDTYLNIENLYHYTQTQDPRVPIVRILARTALLCKILVRQRKSDCSLIIIGGW
jgi:hypothetical protein